MSWISTASRKNRADRSKKIDLCVCRNTCIPAIGNTTPFTFSYPIEKKRISTYGFTLVELLIVIGIIGLLVQLSLPAVEMSRESARRTHCLNNIKQLGLAAQLHIDSHGHLPSGGWTHVWVGDPDRGFGKKQPGGWSYNLLPYIEEESLRELPSGSYGSDEKREKTKSMYETAIPIFICPSRRLAKPYPFIRFGSLINSENPDVAGKSDYAANIGSLIPTDQRARGPENYDGAELWQKGNNPETEWVAMYHNGTVHQRSMIRPQLITDGLSKTLLLGEKFMSPDQYKTGMSNGDDHSLYSGFDRDLARSTNYKHPPLRDTVVPQVWLRRGDSEQVKDWNFGSAHPSGFNISMCDGSALTLSYDIDGKAFEALGSRSGEEVILGL